MIIFKSIFLIIILIEMTTAQEVKIEYHLAMPKPSNHLFEVEMNFRNLSSEEETLDLKLPVWRPGRYLIFDFASGVQEFSVTDRKGNPVKWEKTDKSTWRISKGDVSSFRVKYKVYANEFDLRTRGLDAEHAFIDGTSVFMYTDEYKQNAVTLRVTPYIDWHVTTSLDNIKGDPFMFSSANYDEFVDSPLMIGDQKDFDFFVRGKRHTFSINGDVKFDQDSLTAELTKIIEKEFDFWGNIPYNRYVFLVDALGSGTGGTEHLNSCALGIKPASLETPEGRKGFWTLISHEFFHTWNVKRFRPAGMTPYDYSKENYTSELWIAEGGTSYYERIIVLRTGQYAVNDFLENIANAVKYDRRRPGNRIQSLAESSFDAWIKFWRRTENKLNSETDYYYKGSYVSMLLDLLIRERSQNKHSLDDVFKSMFPAFPRDKKGYTNEDFRKYCEKFAGSSLKQFFDDYVYGTKEINWEEYLGYAGLELKIKDTLLTPVIGIGTQERDGKTFVTEVVSGSSADSAGLEIGDQITALNDSTGTITSYPEIQKKISASRSGDTIKLTITRYDKPKEVELILQAPKSPEYYVEKAANPTPLQKEIYESWLGQKW